MNYPGYLDAIVSEAGISAVLRSLLFDGVTGLPTLPLIVESIKEISSSHRKVGIVFIHTDPLEQLETQYGWEAADKLLGSIPGFLDAIPGDFSGLKMIPLQRLSGDNFLLLVYPAYDQKTLTNSELAEFTSQLEVRLTNYLGGQATPEVAPYARIYCGYSILDYNGEVRFERAIARAVNKAFLSAVSEQEKVRNLQIGQLEDLLAERQIHTLFQPVINLENYSDILGYEALSRGPEGSFFEKADYMFTLATDHGLLSALETLCQESLVSNPQLSSIDVNLFVNLEPHFLEDERYLNLPLFKTQSLKAEKVIIEITERAAINDYQTVARALDAIRSMGFRIAVDDVGSGYASLQSIAYLKPDFIKINEKMVQGISQDFIKQEILKTLRDLAERFSSTLIAEGIESEEDLRSLQQMKVPYGQGYLLKPPSDVL
jgi:EAL domain-containing protein (putative c-di-GMP-specific phosphodiesterase class I)